MLRQDGYILREDGCMLQWDGLQYALISFFYFCSRTAVNNIHLVYGDLHFQQALALVVADEAYSEVLQLESKPRVEDQDDDEQPQVLQAAAPNPVLNAAIIKAKDRHVQNMTYIYTINICTLLQQ